MRVLTREMMVDGRFFYAYILLSEKDGNKYTGCTSNLPSRFEDHQKGKVTSTKDRRPWN